MEIINENAEYSANDVLPVVEECLSLGSDVRMRVSGISMTPLLHNTRDTVVISRVDVPKKYDIVLYKRPGGQYVLHRIVGKKKGSFVMAGDFETEKEYPVARDMIIGRVVSFCRNGKEYAPDDFVIKLYSIIWVFIMPLRQYVLWALNAFRRILHGKR